MGCKPKCTNKVESLFYTENKIGKRTWGWYGQSCNNNYQETVKNELMKDL